ncbi:MAG: DUF3147 family protein, partial [Terriglobia bacterium]
LQRIAGLSFVLIEDRLFLRAKPLLDQILIRIVAGGLTVSLFALAGDLLRPKTFAGIFAAAPSIALVSLGLAVSADGALYASVEARSMVAGAAAFFVYALCLSRFIRRFHLPALFAVAASTLLWFAAALSLWFIVLK